MKRANRRDPGRRRIQRMLKESGTIKDAAGRLQWISGQFLGLPYVTDPLVGSADTPELFTDTLDGFDCVTYMETVLALAGARSVADFATRLKRIRYKDGEVHWRLRNHYMTSWIRNNTRGGFVRSLDFHAPYRSKRRVLNVVSGLSALNQRFTCIPKQSLSKISDQIQSGDLIFFASTRPHLDVFHCGVVVRAGERLFLRHASRSQGKVVEQELSSFLAKNRMAGVILVRPAARGPR